MLRVGCTKETRQQVLDSGSWRVQASNSTHSSQNAKELLRLVTRNSNKKGINFVFWKGIRSGFLKVFWHPTASMGQGDSPYLKLLRKLFPRIFSCEVENAGLNPLRFRKYLNPGLQSCDKVLFRLMLLAAPSALVPCQRDAVQCSQHSAFLCALVLGIASPQADLVFLTRICILHRE